MSSTAILPSIFADAAAVDDLFGRAFRRTRGAGRRPGCTSGPSPAAASWPRTCRSGRCGPAACLSCGTFSSIQLPRSGMMRQLKQLAVAGVGFGDEVDARAAVQLADHDALGAVDDELAAAEHDRHVAQVDFFLDRLLLGQPQPDAEGPAVGQPQLAAFVAARSGACPARSGGIPASASCRSFRSGRFRAARPRCPDPCACCRARRTAGSARSCGFESASDRESETVRGRCRNDGFPWG